MVDLNSYPLGISVVICCYNSSLRLPKTLEHLAKQNLSNINFPVEVIVIDNASTDDTSIIAINEWNKYGLTVPFYVFQQPIPGTGPARDLGIERANYEFILFCDDDNWLSDNYLEIAYGQMIFNPGISALGGKATEVCEISPPAWFGSLKAAYAIGGQGPIPNGEISKERGFIYTAGGVFRKSILVDIHRRGFSKVLTGRTGKNLSPGEDVELCYALLLSGHKIYYNESLTFEHFLPKGRLTWDYYKRMSKGFGNTFPFLMPYKILLNKQKSRFTYGIVWLYITGIYLVVRNIFFELPKSLTNGTYYKVRSNLESHFGFISSLIFHHNKVRDLYAQLKIAQWIAEEYK